MVEQLAFDLRPLRAARVRAQAGIERAADATERQCDGWCERACEALRKFAAAHPGTFIIEHARGVIAKDLPAPSDLRTWGRVSQMAIARGFIERVPGEYFPAVSSHASPKAVYRRGPQA